MPFVKPMGHREWPCECMETKWSTRADAHKRILQCRRERRESPSLLLARFLLAGFLLGGFFLAGIGGWGSGGSGGSLGPLLLFLLLLFLLHRQLVDPNFGQPKRAIPLLPTVGGLQTLDSFRTVQHASRRASPRRIFRLLSIVMANALLAISRLPSAGKHISIKTVGRSHKWDGVHHGSDLWNRCKIAL